MRGERAALVMLGALALACGIGLIVVGAGDGLIIGERGPRLGAFVHGNLATAGLFTVAGALLVVTAVRTLRRLVLLAGVLLTGGAILHLVAVAVGADPLGASGSTVAALLGLGVAAVAIGLTRPAEPTG